MWLNCGGPTHEIIAGIPMGRKEWGISKCPDAEEHIVHKTGQNLGQLMVPCDNRVLPLFKYNYTLCPRKFSQPKALVPTGPSSSAVV